jgi:hypothetical protein
MWQCILQAIFPFDEEYLVAMQDRVAPQQPGHAADVMVTHQRSTCHPIIFTMENKRAERATKRVWDGAKEQLERYFAIERQSGTGQGATSILHGAIAIGMRVQFYNYGTPQCGRGGVTLTLVGDFHVDRDRKRIQAHLRRIKEQEESIVQSLGANAE